MNKNINMEKIKIFEGRAGDVEDQINKWIAKETPNIVKTMMAQSHMIHQKTIAIFYTK